MKILVIAEHDNQTLKTSNQSVIAAAQSLSSEITLLVAGFSCDPVIKEAQTLVGVQQILVADAEAYAHGLAENLALLVKEQSAIYDYILTSSGTFGKNLLPRVAALLNVNMLSDVVKIISPDTFVRPIYAGNALVKMQLTEKIKLLTIRSTAFSPVEKNLNQTVPVHRLTSVFSDHAVTFVHQHLTPSNRPELTSASVVIAGGRGLKNAENFKMLESLADQMGAALGASRAAVDAGFAPNDYQVGQTGKIVAPDLYIAIGISGAIQHLAGMKESKIVVAINSDPDAPIFEAADYGIVMDLFKAIPELQSALRKQE